MTLLVIVAFFALWMFAIHKAEGTRALPYVATLPLWGPVVVCFAVLVSEWLSYP